jgi:hypothetical protein
MVRAASSSPRRNADGARERVAVPSGSTPIAMSVWNEVSGAFAERSIAAAHNDRVGTGLNFALQQIQSFGFILDGVPLDQGNARRFNRSDRRSERGAAFARIRVNDECDGAW